MILSKTLRALIRRNGLTITSLAKDIGVSAKTVNEWLAGRSPRDMNAVKRCAERLGVSLHYLLFGENENADFLQDVLKKTVLHTGLYEITVKKVSSKTE